MAIMRNAATGEAVGPRRVIDGADVMGDAMGNGGVEVTALAGEEARRLAGQGDANPQGWGWWKRWVMREEWKRRVMREEWIGDWWRDWEMKQDAQEEALGIG